MREEIISFLKELREEILSEFKQLEDPTIELQRSAWKHSSGGGGEIGLLRGKVFEKAAVNWSAVWGEKFPMQDGEGPYFATGVSLITHMVNPHAPTVHMNVRYIEAGQRKWVAGGYDLTPMGFPYEEDSRHFHEVAKESLDPFGEELYPKFSAWAKEYFFIPHHHKERGVGGIFFDHIDSGNRELDFAMWKNVGNHFLKAILPIYQRRIATPYSEEEKRLQEQLRAHYVEFNLLYDRGTKFGFLSGGNPEAILCSMPPTARW